MIHDMLAHYSDLIQQWIVTVAPLMLGRGLHALDPGQGRVSLLRKASYTIHPVQYETFGKDMVVSGILS